jgi:hypothetical protein
MTPSRRAPQEHGLANFSAGKPLAFISLFLRDLWLKSPIADRQSQFANHLLTGALALVVGGCADGAFPDITNGQGEMAGEVTTTSVILQSRLTTGNVLTEGDLPGAEGTARFEVAATCGDVGICCCVSI